MKRTKWIILAALTLALVTVLTGCASDEGTYKAAMKLLNKGKYAEAAEKFESLGGYEDAAQMALYAKAQDEAEKGNYETAVVTLSSMGSFKDAPQLVTYYTARQYEDSADYAQAIATYWTVPLFRDSGKHLADLYAKAQTEADAGRYGVAFTILEALGDYEEAPQLISYYTARQNEDSANYGKAIAVYNRMPNFRDVKERLADLYAKAQKKADAASYDTAIEIYGALGDYEEAAQLTVYYTARRFEDKTTTFFSFAASAIAAYVTIPDFRDTATRLADYYAEAQTSVDAGNFDFAIWLLEAFGDYEEAPQLLAYCTARQAEDNTDYATAVANYETIPDIRDSAARMEALQAYRHDEIDAVYDVSSHDGRIYVKVSKEGLYGFMDATGELVIPCEWDEAEPFSEGFALVKKDGKYGYIDTTGELVIPCEWESAKPFSEGLAWVGNGDWRGPYGCIDTTGELVIPCEWNYPGSFSEGLAYVNRDNKYGYIDKTG